MSNANEVTTDAGLIVPASAVAVKRQRKAIPAAKLKAMRRFLVDLAPEELTAVFACTKCGAIVEVGMANRIISRLPGGELVLRCKCSDRVAV